MESGMPEDVQPVKEIGAWGFYTSLSDHCIYIKTDDYHPDPLRLTMQDLIDLIGVISKSFEAADTATVKQGVSREEAIAIVRQYQADKMPREAEEVGPAAVAGHAYTFSPSECWSFFVPTNEQRIGAGNFICVSKATGEIVFDGMAGE